MSRSVSNVSTRRLAGSSLTLTSLTTSGIAGFIYVIAMILILSLRSCKFQSNVVWLFFILLFAVVATLTLLVVNFAFFRYKYNFPGLTATLLYAASIGMIFFALQRTALTGLCENYIYQLEDRAREPVPGHGYFRRDVFLTRSIFESRVPGDFVIWFGMLIGLPLQIVAYYSIG